METTSEMLKKKKKKKTGWGVGVGVGGPQCITEYRQLSRERRESAGS